MLQVTRAKCLIFTSARRWLCSFLWGWEGPAWIPSGSWAWTIPAPSQPPETTTAVATGGSHCSCTTWKALDCQGPSHISNSLSDCAFLLSWISAEAFWLQSFQDRNCSSCSSMDKAVQYPSWVEERILLPTLSELLLSLVSFFNYALKPLFLLILDFWWVFFPHERKQVKIITKLTWDQKITYRKRPKEEGGRKDCISKATD